MYESAFSHVLPQRKSFRASFRRRLAQITVRGKCRNAPVVRIERSVVESRFDNVALFLVEVRNERIARFTCEISIMR